MPARRIKHRVVRHQIDDETHSIARFALELEVEWLRKQGWTLNEIRGLWTRLMSDYVRTVARVNGRKKRTKAGRRGR